MFIKHKANTVLFFILTALLGTLAFFQVISWFFILVPAVLWFIIAAIGSGQIWTSYHVQTVYKNPAEKRNIVAISFDDGPTPFTEKVLDLLKQYNAKGTFFCIGQQIEKYPEIFKRIINEGHTVGNHTYSHQPSMGFWDKQRILQELQLTNELIQNKSGKKALFFRPPYGVTVPNLTKALKHTGHTVIGWNIRSLDAVTKNENKIFNRIKKRLKPGSIILLHDTSQKSVNVLEQLLVLLRQNNYQAVTVNRLLTIPAYEE